MCELPVYLLVRITSLVCFLCRSSVETAIPASVYTPLCHLSRSVSKLNVSKYVAALHTRVDRAAYHGDVTEAVTYRCDITEVTVHSQREPVPVWFRLLRVRPLLLHCGTSCV